MARQQSSKHVDTVIIGSGPSSLILSYILHGHIPVYDIESPHPDPILDAKLRAHTDLLSGDVDHLTEHFHGSRFPYSTQALPVNVLLDTLVRPFGETDEANRKSCIKWQYEPTRATAHVVIGSAPCTGGQWVDNPVKASWDIGALSYAGMLSLPGYSFEQYYQRVHGAAAPFFLRPTRRDVAGYLAAYPAAVGISNAFMTSAAASRVCRRGNGFYIGSQDLTCDRLVLGSGTFTKLIPPRPLLQPLLKLDVSEHKEPTLLVVGSGFSAADIILSAPKRQKIVHIYKWDPKNNPSPLKACHSQAYPEYAGVYKKMKMAALGTSQSKSRPSTTRKPSQVDTIRDWNSSYEGLPNTSIIDVDMHEGTAVITLQSDSSIPFQRTISNFAYVVGRRGSLDYLDEDLRQEICPDPSQWANVSGQTLRDSVTVDLEVAPSVFVIGSLTGDSLIRFGYGACAYAAGKIMAAKEVARGKDELSYSWELPTTDGRRYPIPVMKGLQGHGMTHFPEAKEMQLDRRKSEICVE